MDGLNSRWVFLGFCSEIGFGFFFFSLFTWCMFFCWGASLNSRSNVLKILCWWWSRMESLVTFFLLNWLMSNDRLYCFLCWEEFLGIDCKLGWLCVLVFFRIFLKFGGIRRRVLVFWLWSDCVDEKVTIFDLFPTSWKRLSFLQLMVSKDCWVFVKLCDGDEGNAFFFSILGS